MLVSPALGHTVGDAKSSFVAAEWTEGPCPSEGPMWVAPLHLHHECDEAWYILEGRLAFLIDGEEMVAEAGSIVWAPRGCSHTYWNPDPVEARYLLLMTPKTNSLIQAIHAASDRSLPALKALFERFDAELIGFQS